MPTLFLREFCTITITNYVLYRCSLVLFIVNLLSLLDVRPSRIWPVLPQHHQLRPHQHPPQQSLLPLQQHQQPQQLLQLLAVLKCLLLLRALWQLWRPQWLPQPPSPRKTKYRTTAATATATTAATAGPVEKCKRATAKVKRSLSWKLAHGRR
jgi:hypothetical protein